MRPWLIACEETGIVRDAIIARGVPAISCDILPSRRPGPHHQGYLEDFIGSGEEWSAIIAFPPCTYLCSSGLHWNKRRPERAIETEKALAFVSMIMTRNCDKIVVENPRGCITTRLATVIKERGFVRQSVQPYEFGDDASKETILLIKGLPILVKRPEKRCSGRIIEWPVGSGRKVERWSNQTDSGQNRLGPSETRAQERAETYPGIANAMSEWSALL